MLTRVCACRIDKEQTSNDKVRVVEELLARKEGEP